MPYLSSRTRYTVGAHRIYLMDRDNERSSNIPSSYANVRDYYSDVHFSRHDSIPGNNSLIVEC